MKPGEITQGTLLGEYNIENLISSLYLFVLLFLCKGGIVEQICYIYVTANVKNWVI